MPLTPKQEAYCQHYVRLGNASGAYRQSYNATRMNPTSVHRAAVEVMQRPAVAARIAQLQVEAARTFAVTREQLWKELEQARLLAVELQNPQAMIAATLGKGRLAGLLNGRREDDDAPPPARVNVTIRRASKDKGKGKDDADAE